MHDDIVIYNKIAHEHSSNLKQVMLSAAQDSIIFNSKKCEIKQHQGSFFGCIFSADSMAADPQKVWGLVKILHPKDVSELLSFLGLFNFMHPFIPILFHHMALLHKALGKGKTC